MPLRSIIGGKEINSFDLTKEEWNDLKRNYRIKDLKTVCCGNKAIPKTSNLGTQFFAHSRRAECTSKPETKEHLLGKEIIALTARENGWEVKTEYQDGNKWIADVYCLKDNKKIVFEMQWSPQTNEETERRQSLYRASNIRACWFIKLQKQNKYYYSDLINSFETPVFGIRYNETDRNFVVPRYNVDLRNMVNGLLNKKLKWSPQKGYILTAQIILGKDNCWKCGKKIKIALGIKIKDKYDNELDFKYFNDDRIASLIKRHMNAEIYKKYEVGEIKYRYSNTIKESYLSNGCFFCGAIQGNFYLHEAEIIEKPIKEFRLEYGKDIEQIEATWYFIGKKQNRFF